MSLSRATSAPHRPGSVPNDGEVDGEDREGDDGVEEQRQLINESSRIIVLNVYLKHNVTIMKLLLLIMISDSILC